MPITGGNQNTQVNLNARLTGFDIAAVQLDRVQKALNKVINTARLAGDVTSLNAAVAAYQRLAKAMDNVAWQSGTFNKHTQASKKVIRELATETARLSVIEEKRSRQSFSPGFSTSTGAGKKAITQWQADMNKVGQPVVGAPTSLSMLVGNLKQARASLKDVSKAGIDTAAAFRAVGGSGERAFLGTISGVQRFRAGLQIARQNVIGLADTWSAKASTMQMHARQMVTGITLPLAMVATTAVNSWKSVEKEILQVKKATNFEGVGTDLDYSKTRAEIRAVSKDFAVSEKSVASLYAEILLLGVRGPENIKAYANSVSELSLIGDMDTASSFQFFRTLKALFADKPGRSQIDSLAATRIEMAKLNAISDNTSLNLADLAQAFPEVAPVMQQMGFNASGIASSLAGMYKRGIPATEAAHGLKFALQRLINPTKDAKVVIKALGFDFFEAGGQMGDAAEKMFQLSDQFSMMDDKQRAATAPELFGARQSARMNSYFNDIALGRSELEQLTKGTLKYDEVNSDFLKGQLAAGEIVVKGVDMANTTDRYTQAVEMFKKDPVKALDRMKVSMQQVYTQLGGTLAPAFIMVGEYFVRMLEWFQSSPPIFQKVALGIAAVTVALGPMKYMLAMSLHSVSSLGRGFAMLLPKMGAVTNAQIASMVATGRASHANFLRMGERVMLAPGSSRLDKIKLRTGFGNLSGAAGKPAMSAAKVAAIEAEQAALAKYMTVNKANMTVEEQATAATYKSTLAAQAHAAGVLADAEAEVVKQAALQKSMGAQNANSASTGASTAATGANTTVNNANTKSVTRNTLEWMKNQAIRAKDAAFKAVGTVAGGVGKFGKGVGKQSAAAFNVMGTGPIKGLNTGVKNLGGGIKKLLPEIGKVGAKMGIWGIIGATVLAVFLVLFVMFKNAKNIWESFTNALKPGIEAIKSAAMGLKDVFMSIVDKFKEIVGGLGDAESGGDAMAGVFGGIGAMFSTMMSVVATAMSWLGNIIGWLMPVFEGIFYLVKDWIGFFASLFKGDWKNALLFFVASAYEIVRPVLMAFDIIGRGIAYALSAIISMVADGLSHIPFAGGMAKTLRGAADAVNSFAKKGFTPALDGALRNTGAIFGKSVTNGAKDAGPAAEDAGFDIGDKIKSGIDSGAEGSGESWVKSWIDKVVSRLGKEIERVRASAVEALEKAQDAALKVYDSQVEAIETLEKAEEKLAKTEEYLAKKKELRDKRQLDSTNYQKARALAIYEGRYNDARMLDLQEQADKTDFSKSLSDVEKSRSDDLVKEERGAQKDRIKVIQEAAKERFEIEKKAFEAFLEMITEFTPLTVGEFQSMTDQINSVLMALGVNWPDHAISTMDRFADVFRLANADITKEFRQSGNDAVTAWMEAFIGSEQLKILTAGNNSGGSSNGGAPSTPGGETNPTSVEITPELEAFFAAQALTGWAAGLTTSLETQNAVDLNNFFAALKEQEAKAWQEMYGGRPNRVHINPAPNTGDILAASQGNTTRDWPDLSGKNTEIIGSEAYNKIASDAAAAAGGGSYVNQEREMPWFDSEVARVKELMKSNQDYTATYDVQTEALKQFNEESAKMAKIASKEKSDAADVISYMEEMGELTEESSASMRTWSDGLIKWPKDTQRATYGVMEELNSMTRLWADNTDKIDILTTKTGTAWEEVNGVMVNKFGQTGKRIVDSYGKTVAILNNMTGEYEETSVRSFDTAEDAFKFMNENGIVPGTALYEIYIGKVNDLGAAVTRLPDGKRILIDLDTARALTKLKALDTILRNGGGQGLGEGDINMLQYAGAAEYLGGAKYTQFGVFWPDGQGGWRHETELPMPNAAGGLIKSQKDGIIANIAEGGYDEYVITTDPKYRASNIGFLAAAASRLGLKMASGAAVKASSRSVSMGATGGMRSSSGAGGGGGDVYVHVDTFIGEEKWFEELSKKYNMKTTPRNRKIAGQQRRVVSAYNNNWDVK